MPGTSLYQGLFKAPALKSILCHSSLNKSYTRVAPGPGGITSRIMLLQPVLEPSLKDFEPLQIVLTLLPGEYEASHLVLELSRGEYEALQLVLELSRGEYEALQQVLELWPGDTNRCK